MNGETLAVSRHPPDEGNPSPVSLVLTELSILTEEFHLSVFQAQSKRFFSICWTHKFTRTPAERAGTSAEKAIFISQEMISSGRGRGPKPTNHAASKLP